MNGYFDWNHLVYNGGGLPNPAASISSSGELEIDISLEEDNLIPREYKANLVSQAGMQAVPGSSTIYQVTLFNLGSSVDTYTFAATSNSGWAD